MAGGVGTDPPGSADLFLRLFQERLQGVELAVIGHGQAVAINQDALAKLQRHGQHAVRHPPQEIVTQVGSLQEATQFEPSGPLAEPAAAQIQLDQVGQVMEAHFVHPQRAVMAQVEMAEQRQTVQCFDGMGIQADAVMPQAQTTQVDQVAKPARAAQQLVVAQVQLLQVGECPQKLLVHHPDGRLAQYQGGYVIEIDRCRHDRQRIGWQVIQDQAQPLALAVTVDLHLVAKRLPGTQHSFGEQLTPRPRCVTQRSGHPAIERAVQLLVIILQRHERIGDRHIL